MQVSENSNDDFLFIDDSDDDEILSDASSGAWKLLIVDDDPEIHSVTKLALSDLVVLGKRLEYFHAYSGQEACTIIEENEDIVLVLLDVVMETDDAGLNVVKYIRDQLQRDDLRIVLRTGQPGYAPEENVIKDYDINDYKTKTELTRRKLVTTVYAAIRSFQQISTVKQNRHGLEKVISSSTSLLELHTLGDFADCVIKQFSQLIPSIQESIVCGRSPGIFKGADDTSLYILSTFGYPSNLVGSRLNTLQDERAKLKINECVQSKEHMLNDNDVVFFLASDSNCIAIYMRLALPLTEIEHQLVSVFMTNVAVGVENIRLFQKLKNAAYNDWLTDLPNRVEFVNILDEFARNNKTDDVACLLDLNHFSDVNDGLGQDVGNQLLAAVASRLVLALDGCKVARIGADVFGIVGHKDLVNLDYLSSLFIEPFKAGEQKLPVNATLGFCQKQHAGVKGVKVLNQINIALNLAKKSPDEHCHYYVQEMEEKTLWRLGMIRQLRTDFSQNRLELWYQPQLNLATGEVIGAEALLRWRTSDGRFISPATFIPLAEYSGLIIDIGEWVVDESCRQLKKLEAAGFDDVSISLNVSIPQFRQTNFVEMIQNKVENNQIETQKLELEITENVLMDDPQVVIDALAKIKELGIRIALDDFGTGFSSLSYLQKLPLDRLKVDRAFINDIAEDSKALIADTIIELGKKMGLKVIAEGIEDLYQQEYLKACGCDEVQGFYYAKPMPEDEFLAFLENKKS